MEKVKSIKANVSDNGMIYSEHSIYKLSEAEMKESEVCKKPIKVKELSPTHLNRKKWDGCEWCCNEVLFDSGDMSLELFHPLRGDSPQVVYPNYCPMCGRPLNEEGWAELERKVAVEAHPVVKGRFVHDGPRFAGGVDWWHCSNCGSLVSGAETRFAFCPHCGADMREEKP